MERYSRLCTLLRGTPQELGCSEKLSTFLRQLGFMDLQPVYDVIDRELADFRDLTGCEALPPQERPMLLRYRPFSLADRPGWARDVVPFLALCAAGLDDSGAVCRHTYFFQSKLLQKAGEFQYLDYLFGTRFAIPSQTDTAALQRIDFEQPPVRVEPLFREEEALLVKLAAAALLKKRPIVLKLEKNCTFNRRALELLSQIYSLLPPALAIQTGFSAYQDPRQLEELIQTSPIRIFLIHADCGCNAASPQYLYFDLNQPLNLQLSSQQSKDFQVSKQLFTSLTYWHGMPWRERQPLMELLFADEKHLPNEQSYNTITRSFVREPFIQWINRMPDRGTVTSIAELKAHYDSFPICEQVPILREKFRMAVPELLPESLTLEALADDLRSQAAGNTDPESQDQLKALSAFAQMLLSIPLTPAETKAPAEAPRPAAAPRQSDRPAPQAQSDHTFQEQLSRLTQEKETLRQEYEHRLKDMEQSFTRQYQAIRTENDTLRQKYEASLKDMEQSFTRQYNTICEENKTLRRECGEIRRSTEQEFQEYLDLLAQEHSAILSEKDSTLARKESDLQAMTQQCAAARHQLEEVKASMEQDLLRHRQAQADLFDQLLAERKEHTLAQNAIDKLKQAHAAELEDLKTREADHAHTLNRIRQEHTEQLEHLRSAADAARAQVLHLESKLAQSAAQSAAQREALERMRLEQEQRLAEALDAERNALLQQHAEALTQLKRDADQAAKAHAAAIEKLEAEHISDLNRTRQEHNDQLKCLRGEAEAAETRALLLENKLDQAAEAIRAKLRALSDSQSSQVAQLKQAHAAAIEKLEAEHISDLNRSRQEHTEQLKRLRGETDAAETRALLLENKLAQLERTQEEALAQARQELARRCEAFISALEQQHADTLAQLKCDADQAAKSHAAELETLETDHASVLARIRQEHRDRLAQLESSLHDARRELDLEKQKNARTQEAQKKQYIDAFNELRSNATARINQLQQELAAAKAQPGPDGPSAAEQIRAAVEAERDRFTAQHKQDIENHRRELDQVREETLQKAEMLFLQDREQLQLDHEEALHRLRYALKDRDTKIAALRAQLQNSDQVQEQKLRDMIAKINETNEKARQALEQKHREELDALRTQRQNSDQAQEQKLRDMIAKINETNDKARQALEQKHQAEIKQINKTNEELRQKMEMNHAEQRWSLVHDIHKAQKEIEELTAKLEASKQSDTSGTKRGRWW